MGEKSDKTGPLMVRLEDPSRTEIVRDQLNANANGAYRAWTRPELAKANEGALMQEQIIGIFLGFSVFLGFLIGVGITSQTLRGAILSNIKEYASLRALGVSSTQRSMAAPDAKGKSFLVLFFKKERPYAGRHFRTSSSLGIALAPST